MTSTVQERKKRAKKAHRPLMFIEHEKERKRTFKDREETLRKMTRELSDIDEVQSYLICFGEDGVASSWPEDRQQMEAIIKKCKDGGMKNVSRKYNASSFLDEKLEKKQEKVEGIEKDLSRQMSDTWDEKIERSSDEAVVDTLKMMCSKFELASRIRSAMLMQKTIQNNSNLFPSQSLQQVPPMLPDWTTNGQNVNMPGSNIGRIPAGWQNYSESSGLSYLQDLGINNFQHRAIDLPFEGLIQHNDIVNQPVPISNNYSLHATGRGQNVNSNGLMSCNPFEDSSVGQWLCENIGFHDNITGAVPGKSGLSLPLTGTGFGHNFRSNGLFSCTSFHGGI